VLVLAFRPTITKARARRGADFLLLTPHEDPALVELGRLLRPDFSVDIFCSDAAEAQGARGRLDVLHFYWLDPLKTMFSALPRVWRSRFVVNYYHRNGYWLGLLGRLGLKRGGVKLIWVGFAPNPLRRGLRGALREFLTGNALLGHDLIVCNTLPLIEAVGRRYPKVAGRVVHARWGGTGDEDAAQSVDRGYIFTGGRANRDFETAFRALAKLGYPAIIAAAKDVAFPSEIPENISIVRDISTDDFQRLVQGASIVLVALKHPEVSSGQVVLNRAMRSAKAVVVSATAGIDEYVTHGEDAILVTPGDVDELVAKLRWLLDHPRERTQLGLAARRTYETSFNSKVFAGELFQRLESLAKTTASAAER
jgi:glycosyltransferase involved in cell wall biosynthesis